MNTMTYKGYAARIEYSDEDGCFVGHVAGIRDIVGFHGDSVNELRSAFEDAVDDYLETCEKLGTKPPRPFSGELTLHIPPEVHASAAVAAEVTGKSVDQWAAELLERVLMSDPRPSSAIS